MKENERYIISEEEITLLERYKGTMAQRKDPHRYDTFDRESLAAFCRMKDRSNDLYFRRTEAAREVIDLIARTVGIDPDDTDKFLYAPDIDGTTPIAKRIEEWVSRSGEKAQLKKRVQEMEKENSILRTLIHK
ncbi:MAG: hypothetical protein LUD19_03330 [Clostridia bacterium]|nr:hypothetical protein [Clostridia bacterium]